jgi:hypothetical protein
VSDTWIGPEFENRTGVCAGVEHFSSRSHAKCAISEQIRRSSSGKALATCSCRTEMHMELSVPTRYRWIERWGELRGLPRHETLAVVWRAALEGAPADAIYRDVAGWKTITDIRDPATLDALGLNPQRRPSGR